MSYMIPRTIRIWDQCWRKMNNKQICVEFSFSTFYSRCTKTFVEKRYFAVKSYSHIFLDMALCNVQSKDFAIPLSN